MAIEFEREYIPGNFPVFWRGECKVLPGDYRLKQEFPEGTLLVKGTALFVDFDKMECAVVKLAHVVAGGTGTKPRVVKGSLLQKGDTVMKLGDGAKSVTISSIDTSKSEYDELTLSAALTGADEGDFIQECSAYHPAGADPVADPEVEAAPLYEMNTVISDSYTYQKMGFQTVAAGYEVVILKKVAYPIPADWLESGLSLKTNHSIKYIKQ